MRWNQYSNVLQLAATLSLAGWVARTPDNAQVDPNAVNPYYDNPSSGRYHPYSQIHHENVHRSVDSPPLMLQNQGQYHNYPRTGSNLHQSKDAEENFRSFLELQELVSWQEAYRRGDLTFNNQPQHVMPIINKNSDPPATRVHGASPYPTISDDGYGSAAASIGSPASSVLSHTATNNLDDYNSLSPLSDHVFELNELDTLGVQGAVGFSPSSDNRNFDIDELLDFNDANFTPESDKSQYGEARRPFENLKGMDEDLEYVNSPLKSPTFDEFLASPMPEQTPRNTFPNHSYDDPFLMRFTNSSVPGNKHVTDTIMEFNDFEPAFENALASDEEIDKAFVRSLSSKNSNFGGASVLPHATVKEEFPLKTLRHPNDHDYQKHFADEVFLKKSRYPLNNFMNFDAHKHGPSAENHQTFAPNSHSFSNLKQQKTKSALIWPDFHYTSDELISMPVETFNEVIKSLDTVRQHAAKDVRRKGKNKLAARNCRKRKMDVIDNLDTGVGMLESRRLSLLAEKQKLIEETQAIRKKTEWLNSYIFEHLRDSNGENYSPLEYSLQYTSDGNVYLVPSGQMEMKKSTNIEA